MYLRGLPLIPSGAITLVTLLGLLGTLLHTVLAAPWHTHYVADGPGHHWSSPGSPGSPYPQHAWQDWQGAQGYGGPQAAPLWAPQHQTPQYAWNSNHMTPSWDNGELPTPAWENSPHRGWEDNEHAVPMHHVWEAPPAPVWDGNAPHLPQVPQVSQVWDDGMYPVQHWNGGNGGWDQHHYRLGPPDWDPIWEQPGYSSGARWARSSQPSVSSLPMGHGVRNPQAQSNDNPSVNSAPKATPGKSGPPAWIKDPAVARPLGFVNFGGGLRVPVRNFRLILKNYMDAGWRDVTSTAGARVISSSFDEFEKSTRKLPAEVRLSPHAAVPASTYCLVVRSVTDPGVKAVLEVPDGERCPLRQVGDRPELSHWFNALFPEHFRPRKHHGTPQIWTPAVTTVSPPTSPTMDTTTKRTPTEPEGTPKASKAAWHHDVEVRKEESPRQEQPDGLDGDQEPVMRQRRGHRLPEVWTPGGRDSRYSPIPIDQIRDNARGSDW